MATINKRGPFQFQAQIRRKGFPIQTRTFDTRREAEAWASVIESEMIRGIFTDRTELEQTTLGEALDRYQAEVTPMKREPLREMQRIGSMMFCAANDIYIGEVIIQVASDAQARRIVDAVQQVKIAAQHDYSWGSILHNLYLCGLMSREAFPISKWVK